MENESTNSTKWFEQTELKFEKRTGIVGWRNEVVSG